MTDEFVPIEPLAPEHHPGALLARGRFDPRPTAADSVSADESPAAPDETNGDSRSNRGEGEANSARELEVREVVLRAIRVKPSADDLRSANGSVGMPWRVIGYELHVPRKGRNPAMRLVEQTFDSIAGAVQALARDSRVPTRALRSDSARRLREWIEKGGPLDAIAPKPADHPSEESSPKS